MEHKQYCLEVQSTLDISLERGKHLLIVYTPFYAVRNALKKKAYAYILTQGAELKYFESVRTYMDDWFYEYFGMKNGGSLVVGDLGGAKDLEKQPQAMENAKAVAHQLHQSLIAE